MDPRMRLCTSSLSLSTSLDCWFELTSGEINPAVVGCQGPHNEGKVPNVLHLRASYPGRGCCSYLVKKDMETLGINLHVISFRSIQPKSSVSLERRGREG